MKRNKILGFIAFGALIVAMVILAITLHNISPSQTSTTTTEMIASGSPPPSSSSSTTLTTCSAGSVSAPVSGMAKCSSTVVGISLDTCANSPALSAPTTCTVQSGWQYGKTLVSQPQTVLGSAALGADTCAPVQFSITATKMPTGSRFLTGSSTLVLTNDGSVPASLSSILFVLEQQAPKGVTGNSHGPSGSSYVVRAVAGVENTVMTSRCATPTVAQICYGSCMSNVPFVQNTTRYLNGTLMDLSRIVIPSGATCDTKSLTVQVSYTFVVSDAVYAQMTASTMPDVYRVSALVTALSPCPRGGSCGINIDCSADGSQEVVRTVQVRSGNFSVTKFIASAGCYERCASISLLDSSSLGVDSTSCMGSSSLSPSTTYQVAATKTILVNSTACCKTGACSCVKPPTGVATYGLHSTNGIAAQPNGECYDLLSGQALIQPLAAPAPVTAHMQCAYPDPVCTLSEWSSTSLSQSCSYYTNVGECALTGTQTRQIVTDCHSASDCSEYALSRNFMVSDPSCACAYSPWSAWSTCANSDPTNPSQGTQFIRRTVTRDPCPGHDLCSDQLYQERSCALPVCTISKNFVHSPPATIALATELSTAVSSIELTSALLDSQGSYVIVLQVFMSDTAVTDTFSGSFCITGCGSSSMCSAPQMVTLSAGAGSTFLGRLDVNSFCCGASVAFHLQPSASGSTQGVFAQLANVAPCVDPCTYTAWSAWSVCTENPATSSSTDGTHTSTRTYQSTSNNTCVCAEPTSKTEACTLPACPYNGTDCTYSQWSAWSACTATNVVQFSTRTATAPSTCYCTGSFVQSQDCPPPPCVCSGAAPVVGAITTTTSSASFSFSWSNQPSCSITSTSACVFSQNAVTPGTLITLTGLPADTTCTGTISCAYVCTLDGSTSCTSAEFSFHTQAATPPPPPTSTPPSTPPPPTDPCTSIVLTGVNVGSITSTSATFSFTTLLATTTQVYINSQLYQPSPQVLTTSHSFTVSGLLPATTYNYYVSATDTSAQTCSSVPSSFTTKTDTLCYPCLLGDYEMVQCLTTTQCAAANGAVHSSTPCSSCTTSSTLTYSYWDCFTAGGTFVTTTNNDCIGLWEGVPCSCVYTKTTECANDLYSPQICTFSTRYTIAYRECGADNLCPPVYEGGPQCYSGPNCAISGA